MTTKKMTLYYDDALTAVFLRTLAWEYFFMDRAKEGKLTVKELAEVLVQNAREDLGLRRNTKGAPHAFIQSLRKQKKLSSTLPVEIGWEKEWRLQYLPSHRFVRKLSFDPHVERIIPDPAQKDAKSDVFQFLVFLRAPAAPKLRVTVGNSRPNLKQLKAVRGLYFLREATSLYVGQSEEFDVRWTGHTKKRGHGGIKWWVFVAPEEQQETFSLDSLNGAEALLISFWSEICKTTNSQRGKDKKPAPTFLQQSILLVEAASAVLLWLMRKKKNELKFDSWELPFKKCRANHWPKCYLSPSNNFSEAQK
jgi:hypothetical protein